MSNGSSSDHLYDSICPVNHDRREVMEGVLTLKRTVQNWLQLVLIFLRATEWLELLSFKPLYLLTAEVKETKSFRIITATADHQLQHKLRYIHTIGNERSSKVNTADMEFEKINYFSLHSQEHMNNYELACRWPADPNICSPWSIPFARHEVFH